MSSSNANQGSAQAKSDVQGKSPVPTIAVDIGNSLAKVGLFEKFKLVKVKEYSHLALFSGISQFLKLIPLNVRQVQIAVASVAGKEIEKKLREKLKKNHRVLYTSIISSNQIPIKNSYKTPKTLGIDRLLGVFGALREYNKKNILVVNAGTALTFNLASDKKGFQGGCISPGLKMRFAALHQFTARLPLIEPPYSIPRNLLGSSTTDSMKSGIVLGIVSEIKAMIAAFRSEIEYIEYIVFTGGDSLLLFPHLKDEIDKVDPNLVLRGIAYTLLEQTSDG